MTTKTLLLAEPERDSMSRAACSIDGQGVPPAVRARMTDSAAHHGMMPGLCPALRDWVGFCRGLTVPSTTQGADRCGLPSRIVSAAAFFTVFYVHLFRTVREYRVNACGYKNSGSGAADSNQGSKCNFWSSTANGGSNAFNWNVNTTNGNLNENSNSQSNGLSVRLFRTGGSVAASGSDLGSEI